jgi:hypothetical protein
MSANKLDNAVIASEAKQSMSLKGELDMKTNKHPRFLILAFFIAEALFLKTSPAIAADANPLPEFNVMAADGSAVASPQLIASEKGLLVYLLPGSRASDQLVDALKSWKGVNLSRIVFLVGGSREEAGLFIASKWPEENLVKWYSDQQNEAFQALRLKGAPVLVGIEKGAIQWTVSGVLSSPQSLQSVVRTWVGDPGTPAEPATAPAGERQ